MKQFGFEYYKKFMKSFMISEYKQQDYFPFDRLSEHIHSEYSFSVR